MAVLLRLAFAIYFILHRLVAIFEFGVVAINFFFAPAESLREYYPKPYTILNGLHALHKGEWAPELGAHRDAVRDF